jgi:hypothetical protein
MSPRDLVHDWQELRVQILVDAQMLRVVAPVESARRIGVECGRTYGHETSVSRASEPSSRAPGHTIRDSD